MESIEILFAAYFLRTEDRICAEDAADIFINYGTGGAD